MIIQTRHWKLDKQKLSIQRHWYICNGLTDNSMKYLNTSVCTLLISATLYATDESSLIALKNYSNSMNPKRGVRVHYFVNVPTWNVSRTAELTQQTTAIVFRCRLVPYRQYLSLQIWRNNWSNLPVVCVSGFAYVYFCRHRAAPRRERRHSFIPFQKSERFACFARY